MSAHDSYVDGPYYEQMAWIGDGVQTALATYVLTLDDRLARKSLRLFDASRLPSGLTRARWPARDTMIIAPYSLYWVNMVHDFAFWRGDIEFVRDLMPGVRAVVDAFLGFLNHDGLVEILQGWNFVDWVPNWPMGIPPGGDLSVNSTINWHFVWILMKVAELEEHLAEPELASRARRLAAELATRIATAFWDEHRRLFSDDLAHEHFSEHAQCFAILSRQLSPQQQNRIALVEDTGLTRTTISFTHFLFEAYCAFGLLV
jgi:glycogen debranching enzyme